MMGMTIAYSNCNVLYAIPMISAGSVLVFVGNSMGEGDIKKAQNFMKARLLLSLIAPVCVEGFHIILTREIAEFYTLDENAIRITVKLLIAYLFIFPVNFVGYTSSRRFLYVTTLYRSH